MKSCTTVSVFILCFAALTSGGVISSSTLVGIPTIQFSGTGLTYDLNGLQGVVVDSKFQNEVDATGKTLIPPTLLEFANNFQLDLQTIGIQVPVTTSSVASSNSVFLTLAQNSAFVDAAGRNTSEAYMLTISQTGVTITGSSPLGTWWGTRTLLQQAILGENILPAGSAIDSPGWGTRGIMLDVGRHFYPASFLIEMCAYISFFKQNTFHLHLSDNLFNNPSNTHEQSLQVYSAFRLNSPSPALAGLAWRTNETYTREVFDDIQTQCANRGVTIIPEIEAPGHALVITQWKAELALPSDESLLNITFPETIPTMQTIWQEFLPWFHSKTVHIGADEYDSSLADDYNLFVNSMSSFIQQQSGKDIRIWGTNEPGKTSTVSKNVTIQHWEFFEDNPLQLLNQGYNVLNSDDGFYIVAKFSGSYPQALNINRIFNGNPAGGPFAPNVFDTNNATNNPPRNHPGVVGHIAAQWNDWGPNATTVLEVYNDWRPALPALADKQWGGDLTEAQYFQIFNTLQARIPGQNLDRTIPSKTATILHYDFSKVTGSTLVDQSGNGYSGNLTNVQVNDGIARFSGKESLISTPLTSKGRNYTLSFSVNPSSFPGTLFTGPESILATGNGTISNVTLISGGNPYSLNFSLPLNTWSDVELIGRGNATFFKVNGGQELRFLTVLGIDGESHVWRDISVVAPLQTIGGFSGSMKNVMLTNDP